MLYIIRSSVQALSNDWKKSTFDKYLFFIAVIYSAIYSRAIFEMNDISLTLVQAFGVDHGSMLASMLSMLEWDKLYNQTMGYHSSYYGWTYFFISFVLLLPIKIFVWFLGIDSYLPILIGLKILHFFYGLLSGVTFYFLMIKFSDRIFAFVFTLILLLASPLSLYLYTLHPESVGIIFLNLASIYLIDLLNYEVRDKTKTTHQYYIILLFLVLSALSKLSFLLITAPLYIMLLAIYLEKTKRLSWRFLRSSDFRGLFLKSILFAITVFFVINPFFFIHIKFSIMRQIELVAILSNSPVALQNHNEVLAAWVAVFLSSPILLMCIASTLIVSIYIFVKKIKRPFVNKSLLFLQFCIIAIFLYFIFTIKLFISSHYFIPLVPFMLINVFLVVKEMKRYMPVPELLKPIIFITILSSITYMDIVRNIESMNDFYSYKNKSQYKIYSYIKNEIANNKTIIHDHTVAIPDGMQIHSFHYWQNSIETLLDVGRNADYIIFYPEFKVNGKLTDRTIILMDIIKNHHYKKIKDVDGIEVWGNSF
jgi:hypothetical protein